MRMAAQAGGGETRLAPDAVISTFVGLLSRLAAPAPAAAAPPPPARSRRTARKA